MIDFFDLNTESQTDVTDWIEIFTDITDYNRSNTGCLSNISQINNSSYRVETSNSLKE